MKFSQLIIFIILLFTYSCKSIKPVKYQNNTAQIFQNKGHELVNQMVQTVGTYNDLLSKKDVVYTYTYTTPDGKSDVSTEKYIFEGELSYGEYKLHQRTFPELDGKIEQGYDGLEFWFKHKGTVLNNETYLKKVAFNRPTNFYWFAMFQKLLDPGLVYEYIGEKKITDKNYDIVKISFIAKDDKPTDIYQVYINKDTKLVEQFLFTVADFGVVETPYLMKLKYETINGMQIPTKRQYKKSDWDASVSNEPWIIVTWSDIRFKNGLTKQNFKK